MKTNFHASVKKKHKTRRTLIIVALIVIVLNVFDIVWPQSALRIVLVPMTALRNMLSTPFVSLHTLFTSKDYLVVEQQRLQLRVTELELTALQSSVDQSLVDEINTERTYATSGVQVPVLMRPPFSPYDTLVLDRRGVSIAVGDHVFVYGVLIGKVSFVDTTTATVLLYTAPHTTTTARIGSLDVSVVGNGGGRYVATLPKDVVIEVGSAVTVPQVENTLLGVVSAIDIQDNGTFQDAHIALPVALNQLTVVTVTNTTSVLQ
jgi:cell shape-determining protein MreC